MAGLLLQVGVISAIAEEDSPTVIALMVDGLRPDFLDHLVYNTDKLPNIKRLFYQNGTVMANSYTTLSLTVPSWSETLSGVGIDRSSFKGNEVFNRQTKTMTNYLDWRKDIFKDENRRHGRAYRRMKMNDHTVILDYFRAGTVDKDGFLEDNEDETDSFMTFFPLNDRFPRYLIPGLGDGPKGGSIIRSLLHLDLLEQQGFRKAAIRFFFEDSFFNMFDRAGLDHMMKEMTDNETPKKKFLGVYIAGGDHYFHLEHNKGLDTLYQIDHAIGRIAQAMRKGKYRNSILALVSDHGSQGGKEYESNIHHPLRGEEFDITGVNLCNYLSGRMNDVNFIDYDFNVTGAFATEGRFSMFGGAEGDFFRNLNLKELALHSSQCTNVRQELYKDYGTCAQLHKTDPDQIQAAVSSSQTVYLPKSSFDSNKWNEVNNWYDLTHYKVGIDEEGRPVVRNLLADFDAIRMSSLRIYPGYKDGDPDLQYRYEQLREKIGHKPLDWLVVRINHDDFNRNSNVRAEGIDSAEDVLVVHKHSGNQGLIVTRFGRSGEPEYMYRPIKSFSQDSSGRIDFEFHWAPDPFGYFNHPRTQTRGVTDRAWMRQFHTFKEWTDRYVNTYYPTVVGAIPRLMLSRSEGKAQEVAERPDLLLGPKHGFIFECGEDYSQAHHGMMIRESVRSTMMFSGPGVMRGQVVDDVVFNLDYLPTILGLINRDHRGKSPVGLQPTGLRKPVRFDGQPIIKVFAD